MVGKVNIPSSGGTGALVINGQDAISCVAKEAISSNDPVCIEENMSYAQITGPSPSVSGGVLAISIDGTYLAIKTIASPYIKIYKEDVNNKGTYIQLANPNVIPTSTPVCARFSEDANYLIVGSYSYPYLLIYKRTGDTFATLPDPSALPTRAVRTMDYKSSPYGNFLIVVCDDAPASIFLYRQTGDTFTDYNFDHGISYTIQSVSFSKNCEYLVIGHYGTPYVRTYKRSGYTFISYNGLGLHITGVNWSECDIVSFSPDGLMLAVSYNSGSSPRLEIFERISDGFKLVSHQYSIIDSTNIGTIYGMSFSADGKYLAIAHGYSPYFTMLKKVNGSYIKSVPGPTFTSEVYGVVFNNSNGYIGVQHGTAIKIYNWQVQSYNGYKADNMKEAILCDGVGYSKQSGAVNDTIEVVRFIK